MEKNEANVVFGIINHRDHVSARPHCQRQELICSAVIHLEEFQHVVSHDKQRHIKMNYPTVDVY